MFNGFEEEERNRVHKIEWLDELEEWNLLLGHYMFLVAANGDAVRPPSNILACVRRSSGVVQCAKWRGYLLTQLGFRRFKVIPISSDCRQRRIRMCSVNSIVKTI